VTFRDPPPPPRVSVVIPCYNREDTVAEAVRSVLDQDFADIEVIVVDDHSTDGTLEILRGIDDPRLHLTQNTGPRGPSGARNHGIAMAHAPWIAFQDSDDVWLPGKLSRQMETVATGDWVAVYCGMLVKEDAGPQTPVQARHPRAGITSLEGDILPSLAFENFISTQMLVVRRDILERVGHFDADQPVLVDWELMLRVAQEGPVAFVDDDLVIQRMSPNSVTNSSRRRLESQARILDKHQALLTRYTGAVAYHHHRLAGAHRRFGEFAAAADHAAAAVRTDPGRAKYRLYHAYLRTRALLAGAQARSEDPS